MLSLAFNKPRNIVFLSVLFILMITTAFAAESITADSFKVLDVKELSYNDAPALAVIFNQPLSLTINHDEHLRVSNNAGVVKGAWVTSDDGHILYFPHIEPETRYSISVMESLISKTASPLSKRFNKSLTSGKVAASVNFVSQGFLLPANISKGLPIVTVNVNAVDIEFFRLKPSGVKRFVSWQQQHESKSYYNLNRITKYANYVYNGRFDLKPPKNKRTITHIPVEEIDPLKQAGLYLAVMRIPGEYDYYYKTAYFFVSDIGLHANVYQNKIIVIASSLKSGQAMPGTTVEFLDYKGRQLSEDETDIKGQISVDVNVSKTKLIIARKNDQVTFLPLNVPALDLSEFKQVTRQQKSLEAFMYGPRDLYRPGEKVTVSALLRDHDGQAITAYPIKTKLYRPDGRIAKTFIWNPETGQPGYYQTEIQLPEDAQTGGWKLTMLIDPGKQKNQQTYPFKVEEFLPDRMKLVLNTDQDIIQKEQGFSVDVQGDYLYGAPASGNRISASLQLKSVSNQLLPQYKKFNFGDIKQKSFYDSWQLTDVELDKQGKIALHVDNRWKKLNSPTLLTLTANLFETGGRPVTRAIQKPIWPADSLVGILPLFDPEEAGTGELKFEIINVTPQGQLLATQGLRVSLIKENRDYYWENTRSSGWRLKYHTLQYPVYNGSLDLIAEKTTPWSLPVNEGIYRLEIKHPKTGLLTSLRIDTGWYWWNDASNSRITQPDQVKLQLDKKAYQNGDLVRLMVTPPHDGDAVIMVESDQPLWFKRVPVNTKGTIIEIPVDALWNRHDIYISATVFRSIDEKYKITPNRAMGLIHLPLDRESRQLAVTIETPEKIEPLSTLTSKIKVGQPGAEMYVTLAAVDVGVLALTNFKTPDAYDWFFSQRRYQVNHYDIYGKVIENQDGLVAKLRYGGDANIHAGGKQAHNEVKIISLFSGVVKVDDQGNAEIPMDIPDFNGRLRVMALAFNQDSYGAAETEITVVSPIVAEISLPRFMAAGDQATFSLDIHNLSGAQQNLDIALNATTPITVKHNTFKLDMDDKEKITLRIPALALDNFGVSQISLSVKGRFLNLNRQWSIGVRPAFPAITKRIRQQLDKDKTFEVSAESIAHIMPETLETALNISSQPPIDFESVLKGLIKYPYGCLEQTTSKAFPLVYADQDNLALFGKAGVTKEKRLEMLEKGFQRLSGLQLPGGDFGLWNKDSAPEPWLSPYVVHFMLDARDNGIAIPSDMLDKALKKLLKNLKSGGALSVNQHYSEYPRHLSFAAQSYNAFVLAKVHRAPLGTLRTLYDHHREAAKSGLPLIHLGIALNLMGDEKRAMQAISEGLEIERPKHDYLGDYGSDIRDYALMIHLLYQYFPEIEEKSQLVYKLAKAFESRTWLSTQEKNAVFLAGLILKQSSNDDISGVLDLKGIQHKIQQTAALSRSVAGDEFPIQFNNQNDSPAYLSFTTSGYSKTPPETNMPEVTIERHIYDLEGHLINDLNPKSGEMYLAHLKVTSDIRVTHALVVDLLAAGFEIENQNMTHSVKINDIQIEGKSVESLLKDTHLNHQEFREDRYVAALKLYPRDTTHLFYLIRAVTPGTYTVPPPFFEDMYRPEIRSIGVTPKPVVVMPARGMDE